MNELLLDTHALIWATADPGSLSPPARDALAAAGRWYISAITLVELCYLVERHRIPRTVQDGIDARLADPASGLRTLPVDEKVAYALAEIPRDVVPDMPDRIIAATAVAHQLPLVTKDAKIQRAAGLTIVW